MELSVLTVDGEIIGCSHGADRVAEATLVDAVVEPADRLYQHYPAVRGDTDSVTGTERLAVLHPHSCADGA